VWEGDCRWREAWWTPVSMGGGGADFCLRLFDVLLASMATCGEAVGEGAVIGDKKQ